MSQASDSDEDEVGGVNPMVAAYQDDLDSSDDDQSPIVTINNSAERSSKVTKNFSAPKIASADVVLSSDEEEETAEVELSESEESEDDDSHNTIEKLQEHFASVSVCSKDNLISNNSISPQSDVESSNNDFHLSSNNVQSAPVVASVTSDNSDSDTEQQAPVIMTYNEDLSDDDVITQAPASCHKATAMTSAAHGGVSSRDVVLTDSEDDRPHVMATEELSDSDTAEQVTVYNKYLYLFLRQKLMKVDY